MIYIYKNECPFPLTTTCMDERISTILLELHSPFIMEGYPLFNITLLSVKAEQKRGKENVVCVS